MKETNRALYKREWWAIFFILGFIFINYPIIHIFNKDFMVFGYPVFYLYLTLGWLASIAVIFIFTWLASHRQ